MSAQFENSSIPEVKITFYFLMHTVLHFESFLENLVFYEVVSY